MHVAPADGPGQSSRSILGDAFTCQSFLLRLHTLCSQVAIKSIRKDKIKDEQDLMHIRREIEIMSSLNHPHIIAIHEGIGAGHRGRVCGCVRVCRSSQDREHKEVKKTQASELHKRWI